MYHTLVPQYERNALRREYRVRAIIVMLFALSFCGLIGVVSMFPAYLTAKVDEKDSANDLQTIKKANSVGGLSEIQQKVASSQETLSILQKDLNQPRASILIEEIVEKRDKIKITTITFDQVSTSTVRITIRGVAPTRDSLIAFKGRLLALHPGNKVDLPVSELAKSSDIKFSMQITESIK